MELVTISQVSKMFGVSTRMLRYYEEIGLSNLRKHYLIKRELKKQ